MNEIDNFHPSVPRHRNGQVVQIDVEIAELVDLIWEAGLNLRCSCQDYFDYSNKPNKERNFWLLFVGASEMERFIQIVRPRKTDGEVFRRAFQQGEDDPNRWKFELYSFAYVLESDEDYNDPVMLESRVTIPWIDYEFVLNKFRQYTTRKWMKEEGAEAGR